jgi:hypothetical protein
MGRPVAKGARVAESEELPLPRYAPEAPLPRTPYVPGRTARPEPVPGEQSGGAHPSAATAGLGSALGFRLGVDLFNHGYYWEAHEAWEELWLPIERDDLDRDLLQGLIQGAAALLKLRTGAVAPARTIWARGRARLERVRAEGGGSPRLGVPVASVLAMLDAAVAHGQIPDPPPRILLA